MARKGTTLALEGTTFARKGTFVAPVRVLPAGTPTVDPHCMDALRAAGQ